MNWNFGIDQPALPKIVLYTVNGQPNLFTDGGIKEPYFTRHVEDGKVIYAHESGYGYLPEDRVEIRQ